MKLLKKYWWQGVLFLGVLVFLFSRLYQLGSIPVSLYWDETAMLVDAKTVAETGHDMHGNSWLQPIFPSYGDYKLPVYIWLAAISVKLWGTSAFSLRLVSAVVSVLELFVFIDLAKELFITRNEKGARKKVVTLSILVTATILPWFWFFSRTGFEGFVGQFFVTISLWLMYKAQKQWWLWLLVAVSGAAGVYSYYSVRFVWPVVLGAFSLLFYNPLSLKKHLKIETKKLGIIAVTLFAWLMLLFPLFSSPYYQPSQRFRLSTPSLINDDSFIIQSNQLRQVAGNGAISRLVFHRNVLRFKALSLNYAKHFDISYLFFTGDSNLRHGTGQSGILLLGMLPCIFIGVLYLVLKKKPAIVLLLTWWLIGVLPAAVPLTVPHALRSLNALPPVLLLTSYGLFELLKILVFDNTLWKKALVSLVVFFLISSSLVFFHDYFVHYPTRSAEEWQSGYSQLVEYVEAHRSPVRTVWINTGDDRLYLWFLAFSTMSGSQIQSQDYQNYKLKKIGNINFESFDWDSLKTLDHKVLVVTALGQLRGEPNTIATIVDSTGQPRFEVGAYGQ